MHAYADGELDLVGTFGLEQHLQSCPACTRAYADLKLLRAAIHAGPLYATAPAHLRQRIRAEVRRASGQRWRFSLPSWRWVGAAAALACVALLAWGLARAWPASADDDAQAQEVLAGHLRSLMADHLSDVVSSDKHTVKPWFDGRLDFAPPVDDLAQQGFPLIGGRLDYLAGRPVAALIYRRQRHLINLFVWPAASGADTPGRVEVLQGYNLVRWAGSGMQYWAVSDLNQDELQQFVQLLQQQPAAAARAP
jgi:anti-sigma factor RsiW